ncbi:MAG: hypothetical protein MJ237_08845 [bacterium]|nr:hypothetical protein [bacterium]
MKKIMLLLCLVLSSLGAYADENVLQTIEIEPVKDTYNIVLVTDKAVDVKKTVQASNKINLDLKGIRASKNLNTIYNNVSNVDTVMVEPQGNGISIYFQAENAQDATISFDALNPAPVATTKAKSQKLTLNNPIESYAPIYSDNFEPQKTSNLFNKLKENETLSGIKDSIDEENAGDTLNKFFSFGLVGVLAIAVARLFKRKEPEMRIGLSQQVSNSSMQPVFESIQSTSYNNPVAKPFTTVNYGVNAYKNGNKNPYETAPVQFHNPNMKKYQHNYSNTDSVYQAASKSVGETQTLTRNAATATKMTTPVNTAPVNQSNPNIDNLKFLESMTAIYEKSGRHDLAKGLLQSLNKNNIA